MSVIPCTSTPPVYGIVQFDPVAFTTAYPEFAGFLVGSDPQTSPVLQEQFNVATLLLNNSCGSRVRDANQRETLLNLLTAHVAFLAVGSNDGAGNVVAAPGIVGRVNQASEGAVSISADLPAGGGPSAAYYAQTKYGLQFWTATARFRTFVHIAAPDAPGRGFGGGAYELGWYDGY